MSRSIRPVPTTDPGTYAFEIDGEVGADEMHAMADTMNAAFDAHDKVNMLLIFLRYAGSETGAGFDWSSIKSRFRSLGKVEKYVVVGAPESASKLIETMGALIPVDAQTYPMSEIDAAWAHVGTRPAAP